MVLLDAAKSVSDQAGLSCGTVSFPGPEDLIGCVYDAARDESLWQRFLMQLVQAASATRGSLIVRDGRGNNCRVHSAAGWSKEDLSLYAGRYAASDPWNLCVRRLPVGFAGSDDEYCPRGESEASPAFREFYAPRDCYHSCGAVIAATEESGASITVTRGISRGAFSDRELQVLKVLVPHLRRAVSIQNTLKSAQLFNAALAAQLDSHPHGFCLIDCYRRVVHSNSAAKTLLAAGDGVRMRSGRLVARSAADELVLAHAVSCCADGRSTRIAVSRGGDKPPLRLLIFPHTPDNPPTLGATRALTAVMLVDVSLPSRMDAPMLREIFGLTKNESIVALRLAQGLDLKEIAAGMGISIETVRTHLRRTMSKTGVRRQGALVALVLRSSNL